MPAKRFYVKEPLDLQEKLLLQGEEFHHLCHVMRVKENESIEVVNGLGALAQATVRSLEKKQAVLQLISLELKPSPPHRLILAQALPRIPRLEYILEKSVELGATDLWLFPGALSEKEEVSPSQRQRMQGILISSLKQCGRLFLPSLLYKPLLSKWNAEEIPKSSFFGDTRPSSSPLYSSLSLLSSPQDLLIAIGPESGFHPKEVQIMEDSLGMQGVRLHENILRTDTAAIASLAIASCFTCR